MKKPSSIPAPTTITQALASMRSALACACDENPRISAEWLLCYTLGISKTDTLIHGDHVLDKSQIAQVESALERRLAGEPLQYIVGRMPFRYLELETERGVFIPRPETEVVVTEALDAIEVLRESKPSATFDVLDLCCGSSTIALSLACEAEGLRVTGVDISHQAVELSRRNAGSYPLQSELAILEGDLFEPVQSKQFDIVVSNPPYIPTAKLANMPSEVIDYEPILALDGGVDGLDVFRRILAELDKHLKPGGYLICELDEDMLQKAKALCEQAENIEFSDVRIVLDFAARERVLVAKSVSNSIHVDEQGARDAIATAIDALNAGKAVVLPTDTVFGIGVKVAPELTPDALFDIKRRPRNMSIPWIVSSKEAIDIYGEEVPDYCHAIVDKLWPGPLTIVVKADPSIGKQWLAEDGTIAIRYPDCSLACALIDALGSPLATTSANISGRDAVARVEDLDPELTCQVPVVLEQGNIESGLPSTIVSCVGDSPKIIRQGGVSAEMIESAIAGLQ